MMMAPSIDPITTLVTGGSGKVTQAVFVDGRLSMRFGDVAGIDMKAARQRAQQQYDGLVANSGAGLGSSAGIANLSAKLSDRGQRRWLKPTKPYLVSWPRVGFEQARGGNRALGCGLSIRPGEILGVVGESARASR
jgi:hypothetical protein